MSDLAEQIKADALEAQKFSRKHLVLELDFSEASIDMIETNADTVEYAIKGGKSDENLDMLARIWGAYIGESLRRKCGGDWEQDGDQIALRTSRGAVYPQQHVRSRLANGAQGLGDYFRQAKAELE